MKTCKKCEKTKSINSFHINNSAKDGHFNICKECRKNYARNVYQNAKSCLIVDDHEKECGKCGKIKKSKYFYKDYTTKDGLKYSCIECCRDYKKNKYKKECEQIKTNRMLKYWADPEKGRALGRKSYHKNAEKSIARVKMWIINNPEKHRAILKNSDRKRLSTPKGRLDNNISCLMRQSLKKGKEGHRWESLVPYKINELMVHLKKQFTEGMTWENYGKWHVDHKIPISVFNYTKPEHTDFKRCWSLKNLRPMWAKENISKGAKLSKHFQPMLTLESN